MTRSNFKRVLTEYSKAFYSKSRLATEVLERAVLQEPNVGGLPLLERQHDFTTDYILRTDGVHGWALYDNIQPTAPILQFSLATRELWIGKNLSYDSKEELKSRVKFVRNEVNLFTRNRFLNDTIKTVADIQKYNSKTIEFQKRKRIRNKTQNLFDILYTPDDEGLVDEDNRLNTMRAVIEKGEPIKHNMELYHTATCDAKMAEQVLEEINFSPKWIDNWITECQLEEVAKVEINHTNDMIKKKFLLNRELHRKIQVYTHPDPAIDICYTNTKGNHDSRVLKLTNIHVMPEKVKEFTNKEADMWFGFKKNESLEMLFLACDLKFSIMEICDTTQIVDIQQFLEVHDALRKICVETKTRQFLAFCKCYKPSEIRQYVSDAGISKLLNRLSPMTVMDPLEKLQLLLDFCTITGSGKFRIKLLNSACKWIKGVEGLRFQESYGFHRF